MKILSFNVRGLTSRVKWRAVREIAGEEQVDMILLQETKLQSIDTRICGALWGDGNFEWEFSPSIDRAGGLICIWRRGAFQLQDCIVDRSFIGLCGFWGDESRPCIIINIYSPCNLEGKRRLWAELLDWKSRSAVTL